MRFTRWDQLASTEATDAFVTTIALRHTELVCHSSGKVISDAIRARDYRTLCAYEPNYSELSASDSRNLRQALGFFSKRSDVVIPGIDRRQNAVDKFVQSERLCKETNELLRGVRAGRVQIPPCVEAVIHRAQRIIAQTLGRVPLLSELRPLFGPGATTTTRRRDSSPRAKLGAGIACSEELFPVARCCLRELQGWFPPESDTALPTVEIHHGRLSFVPKSAKTDRSILVEPVLNSMFQMGIGKYLANRLKLRGVDISNQERNQNLALIGSHTGELATLDLSSASDTVALELVYDLLPIDWAHFLSRFRTGTVVMPNKEALRLQKFSSMGNGFTFPLETLIFNALAVASSMEATGFSEEFLRPVTGTYGDDIIVPTVAVALLTKVLTTLGFLLNPEKSFWSGPFRESCGKDYFSGIDIRPFYLKGPLSGETAFVLHNYYVRTGRPEFSRAVLAWIDASMRLFGPDGYGDGHLIGEHPRPLKSSLTDKGYCGYTFSTYTWKSRKSFRYYKNERVLPSYAIYASPGSSQIWTKRSTSFLGRGRRRDVLSLEDRSSSFGYERGELWYTIPQTNGYKRISVYVLG